MKQLAFVCLASVLAFSGDLSLGGCDSQDANGPGSIQDSSWPSVSKCIAVVRGTKGNETVRGIVWFSKVANGVQVRAEISGLKPGSTHAIHIHQYGDINCDNGKCTGGHFNPHGMKHGGPNDPERHVGDMGNLTADASGKAVYSYVDHVIELTGLASILGRGVTLHAGRDDFKTQPTGGAGARIGIGVIGIAKP